MFYIMEKDLCRVCAAKGTAMRKQVGCNTVLATFGFPTSVSGVVLLARMPGRR
jgi:hypothetical protein